MLRMHTTAAAAADSSESPPCSSAMEALDLAADAMLTKSPDSLEGLIVKVFLAIPYFVCSGRRPHDFCVAARVPPLVGRKEGDRARVEALKKYPTEEYLYYCLAHDKYAIKAKKWATKVRSPAGPPVSTSAPDY